MGKEYCPIYATGLERRNEAAALTTKYMKKGINKKSTLAPNRNFNKKQIDIPKKIQNPSILSRC